jgi:hypothetical protein
MYHNFGPSLIIKMDDGDQYFEKKLSQIFFIVPHVNFKDG